MKYLSFALAGLVFFSIAETAHSGQGSSLACLLATRSAPSVPGTHQLFPEIEARLSGWIDVGGGHSIHFQEYGNPRGKPIVYVHGGPGAGTTPKQARFFDPKHYRIILVDQRGCGKSRFTDGPMGRLKNNTTQDLVDDLEKVRKYRSIEQWHVFGGSWGSTLALLYAEKYPQRVSGLILRGIFLGRPGDVKSVYAAKGSEPFDIHFRGFRDFLPAAEHTNLVQSYLARMLNPDESVWLPATQAFVRYASALVGADIPAAIPDFSLEDARGERFAALIEAYYMANGVFMAENPNQILEQAGRLAGIPTLIVHGQSDHMTPLEGAQALHAAIPGSVLWATPNSGHSMWQPANENALIEGTILFQRIP